RGLPPGGPGRHPRAGRADRAAGHARGDPRGPRLGLRRELHRCRPRPTATHRRRAGRAAARRRRRRTARRRAGPLMDWFLANTGLVAELAVQHARLSVVPIVLGLLLALPPGVLAWRWRRGRGPLLATVGLL